MVICIDTETTGLNPSSDEILSISIVDIYTDKVLLDTLVCPEHKKSWSEAERINHISPNMVKDSPKISELKEKIQSILKRATMVIGFNIGFDMKFLEASGIQYDGRTHDVMKSFQKIRRNGYWSSLIDCARWYDYKWSEKTMHTSLGDVRATIYVYKAIKKEWQDLEPFLRKNKAFNYLRDATRYNRNCPLNDLITIRKYLLSSVEVQIAGRNQALGIKEYITKFHKDWIPPNGVDALVELIMDTSFPRSF